MRILFIGNSHTYFNDMPHLCAELLRAAGCETACHEDYQHILRMVEAHWA